MYCQQLSVHAVDAGKTQSTEGPPVTYNAVACDASWSLLHLLPDRSCWALDDQKDEVLCVSRSGGQVA